MKFNTKELISRIENANYGGSDEYLLRFRYLVNQFIRIVSYVMTNTNYDYSKEWFKIADFPRVYGPEWEWEDAIIRDDDDLPGPKGAIKNP